MIKFKKGNSRVPKSNRRVFMVAAAVWKKIKEGR
jgi:hypothetical protein